MHHKHIYGLSFGGHRFVNRFQIIMSKIPKKLLRAYFWLPARLIPLQSSMDEFFHIYRKYSPTIPTFSERTFGQISSGLSKFGLNEFTTNCDVGIVVQGPIRHENSFTLKTIEMYLHNFPDTPIILSTWDDEEIEAFRLIAGKNSNLHIIVQKKPQNPSVSNINLQISSTLSGLKKLKTLKKRYAIKTRTDQCMFDSLAIVKLISRYKTDPDQQKIIILSLGSFLFRPYGASDFFQFGLIELLEEYWSLPHDSRLHSEIFVFTETSSLREFAINELCEVYLATNYLRSKGEILDFTLHNSLLMYKKYFIVIDPSYIDIIWDKYTLKDGRWRELYFPMPYQEISEGIWLSLENSIASLAKLDFLLDVPIRDREFNPDMILESPPRNLG